jgi:hypothetical protein
MLSRWRGAQALAEAAFGAATKPDRAAATRCAIGEFCIRRGLLPDTAAKRALFCMMTGHQEQHRAADPDGSALAAAYQAANEPVRAVLRRAIAEAGDCHNAFGRVAEYLDPRTLRPVACPTALSWETHRDGTLYLSPDGRHAAFRPRGRDELEVRDLLDQEISEFVSRSLARFRPADLPAVTELASRLQDHRRPACRGCAWSTDSAPRWR